MSPLRKIANAIRRLWNQMLDSSGSYAGCVSCGRKVINVTLVDEVKGREVPGETYCWECWYGCPVLVNCDHIELPRPLIDMPWREANEVVRGLIAERQAA